MLNKQKQIDSSEKFSTRENWKKPLNVIQPTRNTTEHTCTHNIISPPAPLPHRPPSLQQKQLQATGLNSRIKWKKANPKLQLCE